MADEDLVVADSGPLIALALVGKLDLLKELYSRVILPAAVWKEVMIDSALPGASEILAATWLEHASAQSRSDALLKAEIGPGESEAIQLAIELGGSMVLLDERKARRIARVVYHLPVRGTIGTLAAAKRAGLVKAVRPLLEELSARGYFISSTLIDQACAELGE